MTRSAARRPAAPRMHGPNDLCFRGAWMHTDQGRRMNPLKALSVQQFIIAACSAALVASVMLSHGNRLGLIPLALAAACGLGVLVKSRR